MICPVCADSLMLEAKEILPQNGEEALAVCSVFGPDLQIFDWDVKIYKCQEVGHIFYVPSKNPVTWSDEEE